MGRNVKIFREILWGDICVCITHVVKATYIITKNEM